MGPMVVLGQDLCEVTGPVRDGAVADLAAGNQSWVAVTGKRRQGDLLICFYDARFRQSNLARCSRHTHATRHVRAIMSSAGYAEKYDLAAVYAAVVGIADRTRSS